jgi:glycosyltransferase involved in cell wall biosynthesis
MIEKSLENQQREVMGLRVLVISHMFPKKDEPIDGIFIYEQVQELSKIHNISVICPIPHWARFTTKTLPCTISTLRKINAIPLSDVGSPNLVITYPYFLAFTRIIFSSYGFSFLMTLWPIFRKKYGDFDLIHAHTAYPDGFAAVILGKLFRKPVVITEHTGPFDLLVRHRLVRMQTLYALRNCHTVIAVSNFLKKEIVKQGIAAGHVTVVPNGFNPEYFHPSSAPPRNSSLKQLLFVGILVDIKGVDNLITAVSILQAKGRNDFILNIVGGGPLENTLVKQVQDLGLASVVSFYPRSSRNEVARYMREQCDVLILPSYYETFGVVAIEALATGKPVIATRCGGPEDTVNEQAGVGKLVSPRSPEDLAAAIESVTANLDSYDSQKISRYAFEKFSFPVVASQIDEVYKKAATKNSRYVMMESVVR